jgi:hypothetical protein
MGYDRVLDYVFCCLSMRGAEEGEIVYSNLSDPAAGCSCQDVNYFRAKLGEFAVTVPESMYTEVARDQAERVGNREVDHHG